MMEATDLYGADAQEWLRRWDAGDSVWSVEMGGMGPGYEQAIQITAAETLRILLTHSPDGEAMENDPSLWKGFREQVDKELFAVEAVGKLGLSGAQAGAATQIAWKLYREGPEKIFTDDKLPPDRKIQVSKAFPSY